MVANVKDHTFLLEPGAWLLHGQWKDRDRPSLAVKGKTLISWSPDDWFTMVTRLIFPDSTNPAITLQYRGRLDSSGEHFTFVLTNSQMGSVEGEGWISDQGIVQRYWALQDTKRRSGFETMYRIGPTSYYLSNVTTIGHRMISVMEATLDQA